MHSKSRLPKVMFASNLKILAVTLVVVDNFTGIAIDGDSLTAEGPKPMVLIKKPGRVAALEQEINGMCVLYTHNMTKILTKNQIGILVLIITRQESVEQFVCTLKSNTSGVNFMVYPVTLYALL